jgi:cytochrome c biogenesis factor
LRVLGELALWIALLMASWAFVVYTVGEARERRDLIASGDRALHVVLAMLAVAIGMLLRGLGGHDFTLRYVSMYTSVNLPSPYPFSALWSGPEGALLLGTAILSAAAVFVLVAERKRVRQGEAALVALILTTLVAMLVVALDPLERLDWNPNDGIGMHPALQSPGAVLYPPLLLTAYASLVIPGVAALAGAADRRIGSNDVDRITRWMMVSWALNTLGILAGIWWVYHEPDRARGWLRFPLESGALLAWMISSAYLVSTRRRMRAWTLALPIAGMLASVPAATLTVAAVGLRSGEVSGSPLFMVLVVAVLIAVVACAWLVPRRIVTPVRSVPERRTYALVMLIASMLMIATALAGRIFRSDSAIELRVSTPAEAEDAFGARWTFASQGLSSYNEMNRQVTALAVGVERDGEPGGLISTEFRQYLDLQGSPVFRPAKEPAIRSSLREDVYVVLEEISPDDATVLSVAFNPFMAWLWIGGCLLTLGGLLWAWPVPRENEG